MAEEEGEKERDRLMAEESQEAKEGEREITLEKTEEEGLSQPVRENRFASHSMRGPAKGPARTTELTPARTVWDSIERLTAHQPAAPCD